MKQRFPTKKWAIILYSACIVLWLCIAFVHFISDSFHPATSLDFTMAEPVFLSALEDGTFITDNTDPQLIFNDVNTNVRLVRMKANFEIDPGEMELFYTRSAQQGFSLQNRIIGSPQSDGSYLYTLPFGNVHSLRIDIGTSGGNNVDISFIELNPFLPFTHYFVPNLRDLLSLLICPGLLLCAFSLFHSFIFKLSFFLKNKSTQKKHAS